MAGGRVRILITGAAGFIGSHLADAFKARGDEVVGVDNLTTGRRENYPGFVFVVDIADRHRLYEIAGHHRPELVVHCAASYSNPNLWHRDTDTNVSGTINATLVARHHGARLVYFQTALPPISSYAITKHAGEQFIRLATDVDSLVFRLANIYGPRNLSGPIPTFFKRLQAGDQCTVVNTRRDMVFVGDLVRGVLDALDMGAQGRYDMCSGSTFSIYDLYRAVAGEMSVGWEPVHVEAGDDDVTEMQLDPGPALKRFGWKPTVQLWDGVADAVRWYRSHRVKDTYTHLAVTG